MDLLSSCLIMRQSWGFLLPYSYVETSAANKDSSSSPWPKYPPIKYDTIINDIILYEYFNWLKKEKEKPIYHEICDQSAVTKLLFLIGLKGIEQMLPNAQPYPHYFVLCGVCKLHYFIIIMV